MSSPARWYVVALCTAAALGACAVDRAGDAATMRNCNPGNLSGNLETQVAEARRVASRMSLAGAPALRLDPGGAIVAITPLCESHRVTKGNQLARGHFVAQIVFAGSMPRFSGVADDTVYWWVYRPDGSTQLVSQFLSLGASTDAVRSEEFRTCPPGDDTPDSEPPLERGGWHPSTCDSRMLADSMHTLRGDNPWFGCTRGCCYSVGPSDPTTPRDSLPADTLRPDTTRRDTTRTPGRA